MKMLFFSVFFLFVLCGFGNFASAQDLLILKSGEEIKANIVEEGSDIVKYRDFGDPGGPLYSIGKDKVATIKYKKGPPNASKEQTVEAIQESPGQEEVPVQSSDLQTLESRKRAVMSNGQKLSVRKVKTLMEDYPDALKSYESGKTLYRVADACPLVVMVTCLTASGVLNNMEDDSKRIKAGTTVLAISGALVITSIVTASVGKKRIKNSVTLYNSAIGRPASYRLNFGVQQNGIGLALRF